MEAVKIIRRLLSGDYVDFHGRHFDLDSAKLWDLPSPPPPIRVAVPGPVSCELAGAQADVMIAVEPDAELVTMFGSAGGEGKDRIGQIAICFDPDEAAARKRARDQFWWFAGGWSVNAELPGPASFEAATQFVTEDDVAWQIPCGADVDSVVEAAGVFADVGFTHLAFVQIGGEHQGPFFDWAQSDLLPALRELS